MKLTLEYRKDSWWHLKVIVVLGVGTEYLTWVLQRWQYYSIYQLVVIQFLTSQETLG